MALLGSLMVSLVLIAILVVATLAVEIDRLPDDPGNGRVPWHAPLEKLPRRRVFSEARIQPGESLCVRAGAKHHFVP